MSVDVDAYYRTYGPMVLRRCRGLLRNEQEALDAMQDVFVQLLRYRHELEGSAPSSLLYRIATNVCLNRIRGRSRRPEDADHALILEIAAACRTDERTGARRLVERLFAQTLPSTQEIAVLHLVDGMTLEEVAREVGLSVSGVRKRLRGLKAKLEALQEVV